MKNFPSKRGSRLTRARSSARRSRPRIAFMAPTYAGRPRSTSSFRTATARRSGGRSDERHEPYGQEPTLLEGGATPRQEPQLLHVVADRNHEAPAVAQLALQRVGYARGSGGDDDRVERGV